LASGDLDGLIEGLSRCSTTVALFCVWTAATAVRERM